MAGAFPQAEFGALGSQARLAKIAAAKQTDYWAGSTWIYDVTLTNGAGAGELQTIITPGEDNEFHILYGAIQNLDASSRTALADIRMPDDSQLRILHIITLEAVAGNQNLSFPAVHELTAGDQSGAGSGARWIVSGTMRLFLRILAVAGTQDSAFRVACRVRGDNKPTVTHVFSSGGNAVVNFDEFV